MILLGDVSLLFSLRTMASLNFLSVSKCIVSLRFLMCALQVIFSLAYPFIRFFSFFTCVKSRCCLKYVQARRFLTFPYVYAPGDLFLSLPYHSLRLGGLERPNGTNYAIHINKLMKHEYTNPYHSNKPTRWRHTLPYPPFKSRLPRSPSNLLSSLLQLAVYVCTLLRVFRFSCRDV